MSRPMSQRDRLAQIASNDIIRLQDENSMLKQALSIILNNATDTRHYDSSGWAQVYVRQAALNRARQLLGRPEQEERQQDF